MASFPKANSAELPSELWERIGGHLSANELACTLKLVNKRMASLFRVLLVRLSELVPVHAFIWQWSRAEAFYALSLEQRHQLVVLTARSGCLDNLQFIMATVGRVLTEAVFNAAAGGGHLDMCRWLLDNGCMWSECDAVEAAAKGGHVVVLRWLLLQLDNVDRRCFGRQAWITAARANQRAVCEGLMADGVPFSMRAPIAAARSGHAEMTHWLLQLPYITTGAVDSGQDQDADVDTGGRMSVRYMRQLVAVAAFGFELPALQQLYTTLRARRPFTLRGAWRPANEALSGPTPDWRAKVHWLMETLGCVLLMSKPMRARPHASSLIARTDAVERVTLWMQHQPLADLAAAPAASLHYLDDILQSAIHTADLRLVRCLREGRDWLPGVSTYAVGLAAREGHLELVLELLALGWQFTVSRLDVCSIARQGHLSVLQWLLASPDVMRFKGDIGVAQEAAQEAVRSGSVKVMQLLRACGCRWSKMMFVDAVRLGRPAFLEALVAEGCPMEDSGLPYTIAESKQDLVMLACLRRMNCPNGPQKTKNGRR